MGAMTSKGYDYSSLDHACEGQQLPQERERCRLPLGQVPLILVLLVTNIITFLGSNGWLYLRTNDTCRQERPVERLPPFMSMDRSYHTEVFNTFDHTVTKYTEKAEYAGDEVEKRWADLGIYGAPVIVPNNETQYFSFHRDVVKANIEDGNAPYNGVPVKIQAQHFLHCVNLLRMGLWYNHEYYRRSNHPSFNADQDVMHGSYTLGELHTAHCVDQLRQLIVCDVDVSVVPGKHDEAGHLNYLDFAQPRQCRNWQSLVAWHKKWKWEEGALPEEKNIQGHDREPYFSWSGKG